MDTRIYEVLEIIDENQKRTGRFRLASWYEGQPPVGLCRHMHKTKEEAICCPVATQILDKEFACRYASP